MCLVMVYQGLTNANNVSSNEVMTSDSDSNEFRVMSRKKTDVNKRHVVVGTANN